VSERRGGGVRRSSAPLHLVATCAPGLESILAGELAALGVERVEPGHGAVRFSGGWTAVWRANYRLRTANRVLIELASFPAATDEELYRGASALLLDRGRGARPPLGGVELDDLLSPARTFAVAATTSASRLRDTRWIALKTKDAIADAQRTRFRRRADVDVRRPDVPLRVWVRDDRATILLDSSREPLDRRGYRAISGAAPLREQLAAAVVLASGWNGGGPVVDPMCGTGTLLIEAGWIALDRAPGALRDSWVFERWPGFDPRAFERIRTERPATGAATAPLGDRERDAGAGARRHQENGMRASAPFLHGRDLSSDAIRAARRNLEVAGLDGAAAVDVGDGYAFEPPAGPGLVVVNPAWGERLETSDQEWRRLGDLFKQRYTGWSCAVIAGEPSFGKHIGLRPKRRIPVRNGPFEAKILVFDLYRGSAQDARPPRRVPSSSFPPLGGES
jgi:23S rRNA G2445 N2-methylase RlmL